MERLCILCWFWFFFSPEISQAFVHMHWIYVLSLRSKWSLNFRGFASCRGREGKWGGGFVRSEDRQGIPYDPPCVRLQAFCKVQRGCFQGSVDSRNASQHRTAPAEPTLQFFKRSLGNPRPWMECLPAESTAEKFPWTEDCKYHVTRHLISPRFVSGDR